MNKLTLDNFSGGENRGPEEKLQGHEFALLQNFTHTDGTLRSAKGNRVLTTGSGGGASFTTPLQVYRYHSHDGNRYTLVSDQDGAVWLNIADVPTWRPIYKPASTAATAFYSFCPFGGHLYFSRTNHVAQSMALPMMRWDAGFHYVTGALTCAGATTFTGIDTSNFPGVRYGDSIFVSSDAESTTWTGPYFIIKIHQRVIVNATGGHWHITYNSVASGELAWNISAANLKTALEAVSTIGTGNVTVGLSGGVYYIAFIGNLVGTQLTVITTDATALTGGTGTATVSFSVTTDTVGPTVTSVPYIIARVHQAGLRADTATTAAIEAATTTPVGGHFAAGTWGFVITLKNQYTDKRSNPVYFSVTTATDDQVLIKGYTTNPGTGSTSDSAWQASQMEIWRESTAGSGVYFVCKTVNRTVTTAGTDYTFPDTSTTGIAITGSVASDHDGPLGTEPLTEGRDEPPQGMKLKRFKGYMIGWGIDKINSGPGTWTNKDEWGNTIGYKNWLMRSNYNDPEAWDDGMEYGVITPADLLDPFVGGLIKFADRGNPIMDVMIEGGTETDMGSNLLVMTQHGPFHRVYFNSHDDLRIEEGCVDSSCVTMVGSVAYSDLIGWWSKLGPVAKSRASASSEVIPIYRKQFPQESRAWRDISSYQYGLTVRGVVWGEWWVWAYPDETAYNNLLLMYHAPTGTWKTHGTSGNQVIFPQNLHVWKGGPSSGAASWTANSSDTLFIADSMRGIMQIEYDSSSTYSVGTTGMACLAKTGFIRVDDTDNISNFIGFDLVFNYPATAQTATFIVINPENGLTLKTEAIALGTGTGRKFVRVHTGGVRSRWLQWQLSGTFTAQVVLYSVEAVYGKGGR